MDRQTRVRHLGGFNGTRHALSHGKHTGYHRHGPRPFGNPADRNLACPAVGRNHTDWKGEQCGQRRSLAGGRGKARTGRIASQAGTRSQAKVTGTHDSDWMRSVIQSSRGTFDGASFRTLSCDERCSNTVRAASLLILSNRSKPSHLFQGAHDPSSIHSPDKVRSKANGINQEGMPCRDFRHFATFRRAVCSFPVPLC